VVPESEQAVFDALVERFAGKEWSEVIPGLAGPGIEHYVDELTGPEVLQRYIYGSGLNIQGIYTGYTGPGSRTYTIPELATARLDARLVTTAKPSDIVDALRSHLDAQGFSDVEIDVLSAYPGSRTSFATPLVQAFVTAAERAGGSPIVWPGQGYGGPWSIFSQEFGVPVVFASGIGHGAGVGQPDEYLVLDGGGKVPGFREMARFGVDLLAELAATAATTVASSDVLIP
jgi:acetylornithine deacetylase/succinyl-diaminopimelate desuccinylase-like protein